MPALARYCPDPDTEVKRRIGPPTPHISGSGAGTDRGSVWIKLYLPQPYHTSGTDHTIIRPEDDRPSIRIRSRVDRVPADAPLYVRAYGVRPNEDKQMCHYLIGCGCVAVGTLVKAKRGTSVVVPLKTVDWVDAGSVVCTVVDGAADGDQPAWTIDGSGSAEQLDLSWASAYGTDDYAYITAREEPCSSGSSECVARYGRTHVPLLFSGMNSKGRCHVPVWMVSLVPGETETDIGMFDVWAAYLLRWRPHLSEPELLGQVIGALGGWGRPYAPDTGPNGVDNEQFSVVRDGPEPEYQAGDCEDYSRNLMLAHYRLVRAPAPDESDGYRPCARLKLLARTYVAVIADVTIYQEDGPSTREGLDDEDPRRDSVNHVRLHQHAMLIPAFMLATLLRRSELPADRALADAIMADPDYRHSKAEHPPLVLESTDRCCTDWARDTTEEQEILRRRVDAFHQAFRTHESVGAGSFPATRTGFETDRFYRCSLAFYALDLLERFGVAYMRPCVDGLSGGAGAPLSALVDEWNKPGSRHSVVVARWAPVHEREWTQWKQLCRHMPRPAPLEFQPPAAAIDAQDARKLAGTVPYFVRLPNPTNFRAMFADRGWEIAHEDTGFSCVRGLQFHVYYVRPPRK